jgi:ATP phosphoribosyltransferase
MTITLAQPICFAIPKGRIFEELAPLFARIGIAPEPAFFDKADRSLQFGSNIEGLSFLRVRAFDVATFVAHGAAQMGVCGRDVTEEFGYPELYAPLDLGIGSCRLSVAEPEGATPNSTQPSSHLRIATKYPNLTAAHFAKQGVQAESIHLNGAMELAPRVGLAERIVDLVSSGATLKANGLKEVATIMEVSSCLIVNRTAYKTRRSDITALIHAFEGALDA